jgi:DHA2 family multidrug resistance protein
MTGTSMWSAAIMVAAANFLATLDMSIANVSVPSIAGGLAVPANQGTWVITSYAVAEAITVPLTGWLVGRFGTVRVFVSAIVGFGICSALCGLAPSLGFLVLFRVLQGFAGGPLMPLSQTLLMQIFPKRMQSVGMTIWAMTTLVGPVMGPILGGILCDNFDWPAIFWVNVPIAAVCAPLVWRLLKTRETPTRKARVDLVGLSLLVVWVGALQILLDLGKEHDWFASTPMVVLALTALIGFVAFLIWELTEREPIVCLRVFRHRGFSTSMISLALTFGAFFASNVLTPLWLQGQMGYTATWAGYATASLGITAMLCSPIANQLATRMDPRKLIFMGVLSLAFVTLMRSFGTSDMTFSQISFWVMLMGVGLPFFFLPLSATALGSVDPGEIAAAAGLLNFIRTLAGAIATSIVNTVWENGTARIHAELAGVLHDVPGAITGLIQGGLSSAQARSAIDQIVSGQAMMISTNHVFMGCTVALAIAACAIWISPKPQPVTETAGLH